MEKLKKIVLLLTGPGVILLETVALFLHIFTAVNAKNWIVAGLIIFFVVFIPLYAIEYFRQEFRDERRRKLRFKKKNKRTEWGGGNVHGTVPKESEGAGKVFIK